MRNKFVHSCSIKICALGFDKLFESIFCLLLVVEVSSLQKVFEMLEEVVVGCQEVRWIRQMRQNYIAQFNFWSFGCVMCGQMLSWRRTGLFLLTIAGYRFWSFQCSHRFLSILFRCNGLTRIQKAIVDQIGSRPPNSDHDFFFGASLTLGSALELLLCSTTELVITGCHINPLFAARHKTINKWFVVA